MIRVNCNLCGADDWQVKIPSTLNGSRLQVDAFRCTSPGYGKHAQIVQCQECGLVYANPRWSDEELIEAYAAVEDEIYQEERRGRELTFAKHLRSLERRVGEAGGRSLLDVGAYIGVFVEVAAAAGWEVWGVEPSVWAVEQAQRRGLRVVQGTQDLPLSQGRQFDVITMWDVIEHFDDPSSEIAKSFQLLKPGGWLAIHTMDIDSLTARLMGRRWPWFMDMHLFYFSQKSLAQMLHKNGFEVIWSGAVGRYLRMGYLTTRMAGLHRPLGHLAKWLANLLRLNAVAVPVNFGDLFTVYARRAD
jgi:cyclopropane fatty-acyl-phospholipid synthase-like methyltransferase